MQAIARLMLFGTILCGAVCVAQVAPLNVVPLVDGATVTIHGQLQIVFRGFRSFFVVKTVTPYRLMFDPSESEPSVVNEIPVLLTGNSEQLGVLKGKQIAVTGKIQLEAVSAYYLNGIFLMADSVQASDGIKIVPKEYKRPVITVSQYMASVTMVPNQWQRRYHAWDPATSLTISTEDLSGCGLNGGGDVVNCFCIDGYHATRIGTARPGQKVMLQDVKKQWQDSGLLPEQYEGYGQVGIDEDARQSVVIQVECTRESPK